MKRTTRKQKKSEENSEDILCKNNEAVVYAISVQKSPKLHDTLTSIHLGKCNIGTSGAKLLGESLRENNSLTYLNLYKNNIGTDGVKYILESLSRNSTLITLGLSENGAGPKGAKLVADFFTINTTTAINTFFFIDNMIGDEGAKYLLEMMQKNTSINQNGNADYIKYFVGAGQCSSHLQNALEAEVRKNLVLPATSVNREFSLLVAYNMKNYKVSICADSLNELTSKICSELQITSQIVLEYLDPGFNAQCVLSSLRDIPQSRKISVSEVPNSFETKREKKPSTRKGNRFGDGLSSSLGTPVEFFPTNYVPRKPLEELILEEGSLGSTSLEEAQIKKQTSSSLAELTLHERALIFMYTCESPFYSQLNRIMRDGTQLEREKFRDFIFYLTTALSKIPKFQGSVFRGIDIHIAKENLLGKMIVWPAFSSSTTDVNVALEFLKEGSGTLFLIESKNSLPISQFSSVEEESECLFPANSTFMVTAEFTDATKKLLQQQLQVDLTDVKIYQLQEL